MTQKSTRNTAEREQPTSAARPAWRLAGDALPATPRRTRSKWLLIAAIILQFAWIAALAGMAMFVRWKK